MGSTRALTDSAGLVTDRYTYTAFGEMDVQSGSTKNDYLYTGEQFDAELDQYYLRARNMLSRIVFGEKGSGVIGYDSDGVPIFDESHPRFHSYYGSNSCLKASRGCTYENVKAGLLRFPAPGASGQPIADEQLGFAIPVGTVRHEVYDGGAEIINVTLERKHILHPGIVRRWVTQNALTVIIHTKREGTGFFARTNEKYFEPLWTIVDNNILIIWGSSDD